MPHAYTLRFATLDNSVQGERRYSALPIRIGRNPLNDCCLALAFVSDFHARVEEIDGRICVRDLKSTNGVLVGQNQRLAQHVPCDLSPYGYEFFIGPLMRMKLEISEQRERQIGARNPMLQGTVLGNMEMMQLEPGRSPDGRSSGNTPPPSPAPGGRAGHWATPPPAPGIGATSRPPPNVHGLAPLPTGAVSAMPRGPDPNNTPSSGPSGLPDLPSLPPGVAARRGEAGPGWGGSQLVGAVPPLPPLAGGAGGSGRPPGQMGDGPAPLPDFNTSPAPNLAAGVPSLSGLPATPGNPAPLGPGLGGLPALPAGLGGGGLLPSLSSGPGGAAAGYREGPPPLTPNYANLGASGSHYPGAVASYPAQPSGGPPYPVQPNKGSPYPAQPSGGSPYPAPSSGGSQQTGHFGMSQEVLALIGLKELAGSLVPTTPLDTTGDIARLVTKLHDAVEVFCRCFLPLRDGYAQFISSLDLQKGIAQRTMHRSPAFMRVEMARDAATLASALLDFRDPSPDAAHAIEGMFADLMLHQLGLLEGVMHGVRALLDELSPEAIEKSLEEGHVPAFGKHKALWQVYQEKFDQYSEEKEAFSRIFGPEFTQSYREYQRRRSGSSGNR